MMWGWTPDGRSLVVGSHGGTVGNPGLQTIDVETNTSRTLWQNGRTCQPVYSPDGRWIAAVHVSEGSTLFIATTADLDWAHLGSWKGYSCGYFTGWDAPTWSADSKRIAFVSAVHGENPGPYSSPATTTITVANTDGSERIDLTTQAAAWARPLWSPDGEWIAYRRADGLGLIRPDGSDSRLIVEGRIDRGRIAWRPDSSGIDFGRVIGDDDYGPTELWTVDVESGVAERLDVGGPVGDFARQP
jgi:TolB protein